MPGTESLRPGPRDIVDEDVRLEDLEVEMEVEMEVEATERRRHSRLKRRGLVWVSRHRAPRERFRAPIADVSRGGIFVRTPTCPALYDELETRIAFEGGPAMHALCRVVRRVPGQGFACCFLAIRNEEQLPPLTPWIGGEPTNRELPA